MITPEEHLRDNTDMEAVSNCCGAPIRFTDICIECFEHCMDVRHEVET